MKIKPVLVLVAVAAMVSLVGCTYHSSHSGTTRHGHSSRHRSH